MTHPSNSAPQVGDPASDQAPPETSFGSPPGPSAAGTPADDVARRSGGGPGVLTRNALVGVLGVLLLIFGTCALASPHFLTPYNLSVVARGLAFVGLVTIAQSSLMILGELDLSLGGIGGLRGVVAGMLMVQAGLPTALALLLGAGLGLARVGASERRTRGGPPAALAGADHRHRRHPRRRDPCADPRCGDHRHPAQDPVAGKGRPAGLAGAVRDHAGGPRRCCLCDARDAVRPHHVRDWQQPGRRADAWHRCQPGASRGVHRGRPAVSPGGASMVARLGTAQPSIGETWTLAPIAASMIGGGDHGRGGVSHQGDLWRHDHRHHRERHRAPWRVALLAGHCVWGHRGARDLL